MILPVADEGEGPRRGSRRPWSPFRRHRLAVWMGTWSAPACRCPLLSAASARLRRN